MVIIMPITSNSMRPCRSAFPLQCKKEWAAFIPLAPALAAVALNLLMTQSVGAWVTVGSMKPARTSHTATLLPNGKVLVAGGFAASGATNSAEVYDPASGTWTITGTMTTPREYHTATLLPNGQVAVAGGTNYNSGCLASAELYDPTTGTWTGTGSMTTN